jgi:hypothetical protein
MLRRSFVAGCALGVVLTAPAAVPEQAQIRRELLESYARASFVPGRIDVIAIPKAFNMILEEEDIAYGGWNSHIPEEGRYDLVRHRGTDHYLPWDYDARIPIVLSGRSRIRTGRSASRASLRDVVPTLCRLLGLPAPVCASGTALDEAILKPPSGPPRLILMFVIDQGGWCYLNAHPGQFPFLSGLMDQGFVYTEARIDHGPAATAVSHAVLGTGAFPRDHGVTDNKPFLPALNRTLEIYEGPRGLDPLQLWLPTLADVWDLWTGNRAEILVYSSASRAALGLAGHGASFQGGDKDTVFWYDLKNRAFETSEPHFRIPDGLGPLPAGDYRSLNSDDPLWGRQEGLYQNGQTYDKLWIGSPGFARFEGEALESALRADAQMGQVGRDAVTDLAFINFKATDYAGHYLGAESLESRRTMAAVDRQMKRVYDLLQDRTRGDMVTIVTADHGVAPLVELSGGTQLWRDDLARDIQARFGGGPSGRPIVRRVFRNGLSLDVQALGAAGFGLKDVKAFLSEYAVRGRAFFEAVFSREELQNAPLREAR